MKAFDKALVALPHPQRQPTFGLGIWCSALLLFCLATASVAAQTSGSTAEKGWTVLDQRLGQGEQCLVCNQAIHGGEIVEVRYKGRRFFVAKKMLSEFESDPDRFIHKVQARSALFDEASGEGNPMRLGWLGFGLYVLVGLLFAALTAYLAVGRARRPVPWFFAGLLVNVLALLALLATGRGDAAALPEGIPSGLRKVPLTRAPKACGQCATLHHPAATTCSNCGAALDPTIQAETARLSAH